jgi:hypothetical protein
MGMRDARYQLSQVVELDEGFFSTEMDEEEKDKPLKRGRGSQKKSKVLVMAESISVEGGSMNKNGKPRKVGHIKMFVIEDLKSSTIDGKVVENIDSQSIIDSDSSASYTHVAIFLVSNEFQGYCLMLPEMKADKISEIYYQAMAKRFNVNYYNSTLTDHKNNKFETSKTSNDKANNHNFFPVSFQISSI